MLENPNIFQYKRNDKATEELMLEGKKTEQILLFFEQQIKSQLSLNPDLARDSLIRQQQRRSREQQNQPQNE